jgi:hypothetical protein
MRKQVEPNSLVSRLCKAHRRATEPPGAVLLRHKYRLVQERRRRRMHQERKAKFHRHEVQERPRLSTRVERVASRCTRRESRLPSDQFHAFNPRRPLLGIVDRTTVEIRLADTSTGR